MPRGSVSSGLAVQFSLFDADTPPPVALADGPVLNAPPVPRPPVLAPVEWRHPRANRECRLGDAVVAYEFQRGQRRTIGLSVGPLGLSVRAPRWTPVGEVDALVQRKADWVLSKLQQVQERQRHASAAPMVWQDGVSVHYLGQPLRLTLDPTHAFQGAGACVQADRLLVGLAHDAAPERLRDTVHAWLMREAKQLFTERLAHFAPQLGVQHSRLRLSSAGTRWGSASADGSIRLNWRLIHLHTDLIDYVVLHELSHLREMNHSSSFWAVVASVMPDYAERRLALKRVRLLGD
ncbi:MAG TPA: SprT family zinc-dependent metalloprotease [Macromonas sp.]|nr:SprT family zinc-dependent metalloprotease [Macromonas sp.]